jgi:hypothetical protein
MFCLSYESFQIVGCELIIGLFNYLFICVFFQKNRFWLFSLLALTSEFGTAPVMQLFDVIFGIKYVPYVYEMFFHQFHKLYTSGPLYVTVKIKTNLTSLPEKLFVMPSLILHLCDKIQESLWEESFLVQFVWLLIMACYWSSSIQKRSMA